MQLFTFISDDGTLPNCLVLLKGQLLSQTIGYDKFMLSWAKKKQGKPWILCAFNMSLGTVKNIWNWEWCYQEYHVLCCFPAEGWAYGSDGSYCHHISWLLCIYSSKHFCSADPYPRCRRCQPDRLNQCIRPIDFGFRLMGFVKNELGFSLVFNAVSPSTMSFF